VSSTPPTTLLRRRNCHRLIPSKHSRGGASVLTLIAENDATLDAIFELDNLTDDRLLAEAEGEGEGDIDVRELVFAVPFYRIINAAFTHAHPLGSRFNGPARGAWYAAFELRTAHAEVAFHKSVQLAEIGRFEDRVTFDDYLADFNAEFHDLRAAADFASCLDPESYVDSQGLAARLLTAGALGVIYPSVRRAGGACLACFRPALVSNVRQGATYEFRWSGAASPVIRRLQSRRSAT
jgi:RES domain-containing protein